MIKQQFETATCATDRLSAFAAYLNSSAPDKIEVLRAFEAESKQNLVAWEAFLAVIGSNSSVDAVELVREMERSDAFRIEQTNDQRALYGSFARNRKKSLQTEEGRALFAEILRKLAPVNEYSTVNMLNAFANIDQMEAKYHTPLVKILADLLAELDAQKFPSVYNRVRKLLLGAPKAVEAYGIDTWRNSGSAAGKSEKEINCSEKNLSGKTDHSKPDQVISLVRKLGPEGDKTNLFLPEFLFLCSFN